MTQRKEHQILDTQLDRYNTLQILQRKDNPTDSEFKPAFSTSQKYPF